MGNNNIFFFLMEPLRDLGKSQWSSFIWEDGITARFGKISMSSFIWGVYDHCEIWENLNGVPSLGGFTRESNSCLKGAGDEYSHGPMRSTVWGHQLGKINSWGTMDIMGLCRADLGKSGEK